MGPGPTDPQQAQRTCYHLGTSRQGLILCCLLLGGPQDEKSVTDRVCLPFRGDLVQEHWLILRHLGPESNKRSATYY